MRIIFVPYGYKDYGNSQAFLVRELLSATIHREREPNSGTQTLRAFQGSGKRPACSHMSDESTSGLGNKTSRAGSPLSSGIAFQDISQMPEMLHGPEVHTHYLSSYKD